MSDHSTTGAATHTQPTTKLFVMVWIGLVVITLIEVGLAYIHVFPAETMLVLLLALSVAKAGMIMAYFMHLRYERMSMVLWLIPALVICISLMGIFFPDSLRALNLRVR